MHRCCFSATSREHRQLRRGGAQHVIARHMRKRAVEFLAGATDADQFNSLGSECDHIQQHPHSRLGKRGPTCRPPAFRTALATIGFPTGIPERRVRCTSQPIDHDHPPLAAPRVSATRRRTSVCPLSGLRSRPSPTASCRWGRHRQHPVQLRRQLRAQVQHHDAVIRSRNGNHNRCGAGQTRRGRRLEAAEGRDPGAPGNCPAPVVGVDVDVIVRESRTSRPCAAALPRPSAHARP